MCTFLCDVAAPIRKPLRRHLFAIRAGVWGNYHHAAEVATCNDVLDSWKEDEWYLNLPVPGYVHSRNADEAETPTIFSVSPLLTSLRSCGAVVSVLLFFSWSVRAGPREVPL